MARLPKVGGDSGNWGVILNDFLEVSLNADGTIQPAAIVQAGGVTSVNTVAPSASGNVTLTAGSVGAMPVPSGTASARLLPFASGSGESSSWGPLEASDVPDLGYLAPDGDGSGLTGITVAQVDGAALATSTAAASMVPSPEVNIVASRVIDRVNYFLGWLSSQGVAGAITEMAIPAPGSNFGSGVLTATDTLRWAEVAETWFRVLDDYDMPVSGLSGNSNQSQYEAGQVIFSDSAAPMLRHVHGNYRGFQWAAWSVSPRRPGTTQAFWPTRS